MARTARKGLVAKVALGRDLEVREGDAYPRQKKWEAFKAPRQNCPGFLGNLWSPGWPEAGRRR